MSAPRTVSLENKRHSSVQRLSSAALTRSTLNKWTTVSIVCLVCFAVGLNATAILSATPLVATRFNINETNSSVDYVVFLNTAWNVGAAIVPLFVLPIFEDFGVRTMYILVYVLFTIFVVMQAVAPNFATLIVARVFAGAFGGVLQNSVDGIAADLWKDDVDRRAVSLSVYIFALLGGITIGPVVGGAIIKTLDWRWILYVQLVVYGVLFPVVLFCLQETRPNARSASTRSRRSRFKAAVDETFLRSTRLLLTEIIVASFTLWSAFAFGTVFVLIQSIPQVYTALYSWEPWQTGVVQLSIFVGEIAGLLVCLIQDFLVYPYFHVARTSQHRHHFPGDETDDTRFDRFGSAPVLAPSGSVDNTETRSGTVSHPPENLEARLYSSIPATFLGLTAGFFVYAWTTRPWSAVWLIPTSGLFLIGFGIQIIVQAVTVYITDCYPRHAGSAISAVAFGENILAAFLPLATKSMYGDNHGGLGFQWASSLLGFVALALGFAPVVLVVFGARVRRNSRWTS